MNRFQLGIVALVVVAMCLCRRSSGQCASADVAPVGGNGSVDVDDLIAVILGWGACTNPTVCTPCESDINCSHTTDVDDLIAVILNWGTCPESSWVYAVNEPAPPNIVGSPINLTSPCIAEIESAIGSGGVKVVITGTVLGGCDPGTQDDAILETHLPLDLDADDVWLDFSGADPVQYVGGNTATNFIDMDGRARVRISGLNYTCLTTGRSRGLRVDACTPTPCPTTDLHLVDCTFANTQTAIELLQIERVKLEAVTVNGAGDTIFCSCPPPNETQDCCDEGYALWIGHGAFRATDIVITDCTFITDATTSQYPTRIANPLRCLIEGSEFIQGSTKRAFWTYGANQVTIRNCLFDGGSAFQIGPQRPNSKGTIITELPTEGIRLEGLTVQNVGGDPTEQNAITIKCGYGTSDVRMRNTTCLHVTTRVMVINWRDDVDCNPDCMPPYTGTLSSDIVWFPTTMFVDDDDNDMTPPVPIGPGDVLIEDDWSDSDVVDLRIGPPCTGATCNGTGVCVNGECG